MNLSKRGEHALRALTDWGIAPEVSTLLRERSGMAAKGQAWKNSRSRSSGRAVTRDSSKAIAGGSAAATSQSRHPIEGLARSLFGDHPI
jgi:hypothetical protein